jgi:iron(III) transport system substrate-binding protein
MGMKLFSSKMRLAAIFLIVLMTGSLLAACGKTASEPATTNTAEKTTGSSAPQESSKPANQEIYLYQEADRDQKLIEKAKEEGTVVLYTSINLDNAEPIAEAFEKKYGIKVVLWRAGSEKVLQRVVTEGQAGRFDVDVIETNGPELEAISREGLTSEFYSPYLADLPPEALPSHKKWAADRFNFFVAAYNTDKIKPEEAPKTYEEILDPKWKGKIGLESGDVEWFAAIVKTWGEEKGLDYFKELASMDLMVRKGHTLVTELVASGEIPLALTVYNHKAEQLKKKGAPLEWMPIQPAIARPNGIAVAKNAPHPHAALLFTDFMLSPEGQELLNSLGRVPSSTKVDSNLNKFKYKMVDPVIVLDEWDKWSKLWDEIILKK